MQDDMTQNAHHKKSSDRPIEIAKGIYWVGVRANSANKEQKHTTLTSNPFIILENGEATVIDGGSRPDFPTTMMKILQIGIKPEQISTLIYHHYDPDLCSSIPHFEEIIQSDDLQIVSMRSNEQFIRHYNAKAKFTSIESLNNEYLLGNKRKLRFITTPYCHTEGSFVSFDDQTGTLFSSDLFGSYFANENILLENLDNCRGTTVKEVMECKHLACELDQCPFQSMLKFNKAIMTSTKALRYTLAKIRPLPIKMIATQHGSIFTGEKLINQILNLFSELENVGIDAFV